MPRFISMKRFPLRETLWLCAPICLLVVGFGAAQWRAAEIAAEIEAAKPRIESCKFRAPNAREVFEGARVVLTTRASWPEKFDAQTVLILTDKHGRQFHSQQRSWVELGTIGGHTSLEPIRIGR